MKVKQVIALLQHSSFFLFFLHPWAQCFCQSEHVTSGKACICVYVNQHMQAYATTLLYPASPLEVALLDQGKLDIPYLQAPPDSSIYTVQCRGYGGKCKSCHTLCDVNI